MRCAVRVLADLGPELVLAPERYIADPGAGEGIPLGELVTMRTEAAEGLVLDTTHARDGVLDIASALRSPATAKSTKKAAYAGDIIVSRLRPYLRQIAYVHPTALAAAGRPLAVSSEFYVLAPKREEPDHEERTREERRRTEPKRAKPRPEARVAPADIAFLVPFLLSDRVQAILAASQEGGHHPRVPRASVLALRVPTALVRTRRDASAEVLRALDAVYRAHATWTSLI